MAIDLVTKFEPYVDEMFTTEAKKSLVTNNDFTWTGAHTVKVYKISTATMNDYDREGTNEGNSRYGTVASLNATTEELTLTKDRSFTFAIDKMDKDETAQQLAGASALARQEREVIIPEVDTYVFNKMCTGAGNTPSAIELTETNIYDEILKATEALDDAEAPDTGRVLIVTPTTYKLLKQCPDITLDSDVAQEQRLQGVIAMVDGLSVVKVPAKRLPAQFGFMVCHKVATVAPAKLEDYKVHSDPPGISGDLVEGRIVYDAFVLENKKNAIYYQAVTAE
ncbi:hypothetical protein [Faecalicoccus pleomorphus]|uniref:Carbohydrate-binding family V/XII n=1 Tax=Faecalicoccus pleomorphus TaxID=1323 RepID=A0A380LNZ6_9FIRM|nr:hypothetical protein [Faecalicoccus pleomorphus]MBM6808576.1 hypothetical protein [Faecalicoccus pleomorphus]SUO04320.1 Carbohydrate-binding family V/XII [Faecalicoccus pleomorphus]